MAGITSKALTFGDPQNKKKYNGIEFENVLGIGEYEAQLRNLDPQVGRWWEIDPKTENQEIWSPYVSNNDNPIQFADPLGDEAEGCCGGFFERFWDNAKANYRGAKEWVVDTWNQAGENYRNRKEAGALPWQNFDPMVVLSPVPVGKIGQVEKVLAIDAKIGTAELKTTESIFEKAATPLNRLESSASKNLGESFGNTGFSKPLPHSNAIRGIVRNASKAGVVLTDKKIEQLGRVVSKSGGKLRTEIGVKGSVKGIKHTHVEGYGSSTESRHIIHENQK